MIVAVTARPTTQVRPQPSQQDAQLERLGEMIVRSGVEAHDDVQLGAPGGHDDQQEVGVVSAQPSEEVDPVSVGKSQVDQHDVGSVAARQLESGLSRTSPYGAIATAVEAVDHATADRRVVFDDQHRAYLPPCVSQPVDHRPRLSE